MAYVICFAKNVIKNDIPAIPAANYDTIMRAIHERLAVAPLDYGKPLRHELAGLYSLGVGNWRVGYYIEGNTVIIVHIDPRRDAYKNWKRLLF